MKKTLFAVAALALCGTAFGDTEIKTSDYAGQSIGTYDGRDYVVDDTAIITVDSSVPTGEASEGTRFKGKTTVVFDGANIWNTNAVVVFQGGLNITSTATAAQNWIEALTTTGQITLFGVDATSGYSFQGPSFKVALLEGVEKGGEITLTGTTDTLTATYVGYIYKSPAAVELNDGEIAFVNYCRWEGTGADKRWVQEASLVGKGLTKTPLVPEPATATLSLLALAGLASRRRRK